MAMKDYEQIKIRSTDAVGNTTIVNVEKACETSGWSPEMFKYWYTEKEHDE